MGLKILSFIHCVVAVFGRHVHHAHSFAITGISAGVQSSGERPFRTEINQFSASGAPFDLFILATQAIQQLNENELLSFFQISGEYHNVGRRVNIDHGFRDPWLPNDRMGQRTRESKLGLGILYPRFCPLPYLASSLRRII